MTPAGCTAYFEPCESSRRLGRAIWRGRVRYCAAGNYGGWSGTGRGYTLTESRRSRNQTPEWRSRDHQSRIREHRPKPGRRTDGSHTGRRSSAVPSQARRTQSRQAGGSADPRASHSQGLTSSCGRQRDSALHTTCGQAGTKAGDDRTRIWRNAPRTPGQGRQHHQNPFPALPLVHPQHCNASKPHGGAPNALCNVSRTNCSVVLRNYRPRKTPPMSPIAPKANFSPV